MELKVKNKKYHVNFIHGSGDIRGDYRVYTICVISRGVKTFTGMAVRRWDERGDEALGENIALKRAVEALANARFVDEWCNTARVRFRTLYSQFRLARWEKELEERLPVETAAPVALGE